MRKRLQIFCLLLLPCLTLMGILGRGSPAALSASSDAAIPASADNWGLSFPAEHETPIGNATADFLTQYDAWYVGDTSQKVIYLTFDCGYENGNTEAILDALKKHSAPAAFFVVGHMIESAPDIVRRMAAEGHIVGNHTYHHPDMSAISDKASFQKELDSLAALYQEITGSGTGLPDSVLEPCLRGLVCRQPAHSGAGLRQAAPPHPQRCHRAAALYLLHQRRHSGRSAVEVGGHGLPLRPPDGAFRPGQVLTSCPAVSKKFHCPK